MTLTPLEPLGSGKPGSLPAELATPGAVITLEQALSIALENNPATQASYLQARSAAASLGLARSQLYPNVQGNVNLGLSQQDMDELDSSVTDTYGAVVTLNHLLWDVGGRAAQVEGARLALMAADFSHNAAIEDVILSVSRSFVLYVSAKAQKETAQVSLQQAETALDAATQRHEAGVATISDVLQARTAVAQSQLELQSVEGEVMVRRGALSTEMGLSATTPLDVGALPPDIPLDRVWDAVEVFIEKAQMDRKDLAALQAQARVAAENIRVMESKAKPSISFSAQAGELYGIQEEWTGNWTAGLMMSMPIFTGFGNQFDIQKAREDADLALTLTNSLEQQITLQVWTSYYALQTVTQLVKTSHAVVLSAEEAERVALGRYKEGVGTILDLLVVQSTLSKARAQEIEARSGWFMALAQLTHDCGQAASMTENPF